MRAFGAFQRSSLLLRRRRANNEPYALVPSGSFCTDNGFETTSNDSSRVSIFDRHLKRKQRDRAAWLTRPNDSFVDAVAENLLDRLEDCRKTFPTALCLGGSLEAVRRLLRGRGGIEKLIMMDTSYDMLKSCKDAQQDAHNDNIETFFVVGDEEFLPLKERELRVACTVAQMEREGGISPRVSPLAQVRDAGNLLTRAGFTLPSVDVDQYTVKYNSSMELIEHLRAMGETNALLQRNKILNRETALATAAIYDSMFAAEDGSIPATFQVIYMTGWREHYSQPKPKRRGSATVSFKDIHKHFGSENQSAQPS
ncbi:putative methyltransferase At1g22800, mitochondrial isoform X2 [Citrus clementina]|uniref:putative methyltransferase At1g22800, mitochondrial isoform X2 n=1 Tax=Citrus clementina TaxID=85681 RepID=UPI000CED5AD2|nr:putative methyltransferase At1g22800, mitochondrial isoform X2 [Citrus x clementina]